LLSPAATAAWGMRRIPSGQGTSAFAGPMSGMGMGKVGLSPRAGSRALQPASAQ
jgi:hypothetical protein